MRKIIGVAVSCLVACSLFLIVQPAFAASYSGAWEIDNIGTEDDNFWTFELTLSGDAIYGIYDFNGSAHVELPGTASTISFDADTGEVFLANPLNAAAGEGGTGKIFSSPYRFGFYKGEWGSDGSSVDRIYDLTGYEDNWNLKFDENCEILVVVNANPVPIPTAMLLLSSGLVGLAGFKRKMDN